MTLRYIALSLENEVNGRMYSSDFIYHTRFISNYFSKAIRKYKYETDGTFKMISIALLPMHNLKETQITAINVLETYIPFNQERYEQIRGTEDCSYYLEVLEEGFKKASEFKTLPLDILLNLIKDFRMDNCKNEWIHKKKNIKLEDIEVILSCEFTTNYFQLLVQINQISTKKELTKGVAIKTMPDEIHFQKMFKNIEVENGFIVITDASDSPRVLINIEKAKQGIFNKTFAPYIYSADYTEEENRRFEDYHNQIVQMLSYEL